MASRNKPLGEMIPQPDHRFDELAMVVYHLSFGIVTDSIS
jgi:hypothetical protein